MPWRLALTRWTPTSSSSLGRATSQRGHCTLVFASLPGRCTFSGGTGKFTHFRASVAVSVDETGLWHWEGTYSFRPQD